MVRNGSIHTPLNYQPLTDAYVVGTTRSADSREHTQHNVQTCSGDDPRAPHR